MALDYPPRARLRGCGDDNLMTEQPGRGDMTIHATKADVDQAHERLTTALGDLTLAAIRWQQNPSDGERRRRITADAWQQAQDAADGYEQVLTAWAAGPNAAQPETSRP